MSEAGWIALFTVATTIISAAIAALAKAIWSMHTDMTVLKRDQKWIMKNLNDWKYVFKSLIKDGAGGSPESDSDEPEGVSRDSERHW